MTTPVGSIRIDLTVDGSKADKQVAAAVNAAVKPALAEVQKLDKALGSVGAGGATGLGRLRSELNDVAGGAARAQDAVRRIGDATRTVNTDGATGLGRMFGEKFAAGVKVGLGAITAANLVGMVKQQFGAVLDVGMDYTRTMNTMQAVTGATADQLAKAGAAARALGNDMSLPGTSANDAAAAMTELAKGGFTVQQSMEAARGSLQLAAAAGISAAQAATIQSQALQAFGLSAADASKMSDTLANAANASSAEITDVAAAMAQAGTVANQFGLSAQDTAAAIALLANNGIKGSDAGTLLKTSLLALTDQGNPAQGAIKELGLAVYDAGGKFVGMRTLMDQLGAASKRMTPEAYQAATATLFGSDAMRMAGVAAKDGAKSYDSMRESINRQGAAADVAAARMRGLPGASENFKNAVEALRLKVYDFVEGPLTALGNKGADALNGLGKNQAFAAIGDGVKAIAPALGEIGRVALSAAGAIGGAAWQSFVVVLRGMAGVLQTVAPLLSGIGSVLRDNQGLVTAAVAAWAGFRFLPSVLGRVSEAFLPVSNGLRQIGPQLGAVRSNVGLVGESWRTMVGYMQQANPAMTAAEAKLTLLRNGASGLASGGLGLVRGAASGLVGVLGGPLNVALMGATAAFGLIEAKNASAAAAAQGYRDAVKASADAQTSLNEALLRSNGIMDEASRAEASKTIQSAQDELKKKSQSQSTFLDKFRNEQGSLAGAFDSAYNSRSLADVKDQTARIAGEATAAINGLGLTQKSLEDQIIGAQPTFDALVASLQKQGEGGAVAADRLKAVRTEILGAEKAGATAGPVLARLGGDVAQSAANIKTAFAALPTDVPINVSAPGGQPVFDLLQKLGVAVSTDNQKRITVDAPMAPEVLATLKALGVEVRTDNGKLIVVKQQGAEQAAQEIDRAAKDRDTRIRVTYTYPGGGPIDPSQLVLPGRSAGLPAGVSGGRADGGVLPGYSPGVDTMLVPMSGGEGVLIPEAVRALGPGFVYRVNAMFRPGLASKGYDSGGVVGSASGRELSPLAVEVADGLRDAIAPMLDRLQGIREALATGVTGGLSAVRDAVNKNGAGTVAGLSSLLPGLAASTTPTTAVAAVGPVAAPAGSIDGEHPQITMLEQVAKRFGLSGFTGNYSHPQDGKFHPKGMAGDFSAPKTPEGIAAMDAFSNWATQTLGPYLRELIHQGPGTAVNAYKGAPTPAIDMPGSVYNTGQAGDHSDHVHIAIEDSVAQAVMQALSGGVPAGAAVLVPQPLPGLGGAVGAAAATSADPRQQVIDGAQTQLDQLNASLKATADAKARRDAQQAVEDAQFNLRKQQEERDKALADPKKTALEREEAERAYQKSLQGLTDAQDAQTQLLAQQQAGVLGDQIQASQKWLEQATKTVNYDDLPYGDPTRIKASFLRGLGMSDRSIDALIGKPLAATVAPAAAVQAGGAAVGAVAPAVGGAIAAASQVTIPGPLGYPSTPTAPATDPAKLVAQGNLAAVPAAAGLAVPDYTRQGGGASAKDVAATGQPTADAMGRIYSDTSALIDRTFSNLDAAEKARHDQVMSVLNQISQKIGKDVIAPSVQAGVEAAGPALAKALPGGKPMADGGPVTGGTPGVDSVPILGQPGEFMLDVATVGRLGGPAGVEALRQGLARRGGFRLMAAGGPVDASATVGADFLGVGQIPLIGAIVNGLVQVLLKVIGVQIEQRNTLVELGKDFKGYRGDFTAADAMGRTYSDTSGLSDRTTSSTQEAADERLRILKLVLDGLVKYVIEQIIVPIGKAVGNSLLQMGSGALSAGLGAAFPGGGEILGSIVGQALTTGGAAGIDIAAQIGTSLAENAISIGLEGVKQALPSVMPGIVSGIFGGGAMAALADPITAALSMILGGVAAVFTAGFGAAGTFDSGGEAIGAGVLHKAVIEPERVLSPSETRSFNRLVASLERGATVAGGGDTTTSIHAPITVLAGGADTGRQIRDNLLSLLS